MNHIPDTDKCRKMKTASTRCFHWDGISWRLEALNVCKRFNEAGGHLTAVAVAAALGTPRCPSRHARPQ